MSGLFLTRIFAETIARDAGTPLEEARRNYAGAPEGIVLFEVVAVTKPIGSYRDRP